jgi:hypothetical protein
MTLPVGVRAYLPRRPLRVVKWTLRFAANIVLRPAERADDPYATHVPVLIGLARMLNVERVIEYGCGHYSTLTFLDRSAFPGLIKLLSLENDAEWFEKIAGQVNGDPRVEMWNVSGPMSSAASVTELSGYDIAFIDDSMNPSERATTIREIAAKRPDSTVVVVHDYETAEYRRAARAFTNRFNFDSLNPNTGVLWNNAPITKRDLRSLDKLIKRHAGRLQPSDVRGWVQALTVR